MHINPQGKVQFILVAAAHASLLIMLADMKIQSSIHFVNARGKAQTDKLYLHQIDQSFRISIGFSIRFDAFSIEYFRIEYRLGWSRLSGIYLSTYVTWFPPPSM